MDILADLAPLTPAEEKLLAEAGGTSRVTFGDGERPLTLSPETQIRARLIRALLLNEVPEVSLDKKGIRLRGAWISEALDLQGVDCNRDITLSLCHLESSLILVNASVRGLHISNCAMAGISGDNAQFSGSVYVRSETVVKGEIAFSGARISGDLQICDVMIESTTSDAIFAPSLQVEGSVFLGNYPYSENETSLVCDGMLFFSSVRVAHDFFVSNVAVNISDSSGAAAYFNPNEEHGSNIALSLARAHVGGLLLLQNSQIPRGIVNLAGADVERFKDEPVGPGAQYPIRLDGFQYRDFSRHTDTGIVSRLAWLERRPDDTPFTPQPYEQLAYVLKRIGHRGDARSVLMHKERSLRAEGKRRARSRKRWLFFYPLAVMQDLGLRITIGYGYRPTRAALWAVLLILSLGFFFQKTWDAGDMAPNPAPILISQPWIDATKTHPTNPAAYWSQPGQAGQDFETFNAYAYAADLVIPIVSLGQETAWAPSTSRSPLGRVGWWIRWFAVAIGWMVTALGAAAITGVIRHD
jgi:hypothetical protein